MYHFKYTKGDTTVTLLSADNKDFIYSEMEHRKDFTKVLNYVIEDTPTGFLLREKANGPVVSRYEICYE